MVEAGEKKAVAVTTLDAKPTESPMPFSGDAWAAAMSAGVEEKLAPQGEPMVAEVSPAPEPIQETSPVETAHSSESPAVAEIKSPEAPSWPPVPESSWEAEAKRASMLASTWDAPAPVAPTEETQEISAYSPEQPEAHTEVHAVEEAPSPYSGHYEPEAGTEAPETPTIDTSAEVAVEATPAGNWSSAWEAPVTPAVEEPVIEAAVTEPVRDVVSEMPQVETHAADFAASELVAATEPAKQPDMDELVARVLGKMNPDVLQKVTREILKPVIEAIVRDELDSKK